MTWVEQLASKREDVGADKAVAVSATGFTKGARNAAATFGIPLRTLQQVSLSEVLLWFPFTEISLDKLCWELHHIDISVDQDALKSLSPLLSSVGDTATPRVNDVHFRAKHNGSVALIWQHLWNDLPGPTIYAGVPSDGTRIRRIVRIGFPDAQHRYQIDTATGYVDVMEITIFADLWIEREQIPIAIVQSYNDEGHTLARDAQFRVEHEGGKFVVSISEYPDKGTQSIALWGVSTPDMATILEADVSDPQSKPGQKVVRLIGRGH